MVRALVQLVVVVAFAATTGVAGLVVGLAQPDLGANVADSVIASPAARTEIATSLANDVEAATAGVFVLPGLNAIAHDAIGSQAAEPLVHAWVERHVQGSYGKTSTAESLAAKVGLGSLAAAAGSFVAVRLLVSRSRAAMCAGIGGLAGAALLWVLPSLASFHSAQASLLAVNLVDDRFVVAAGVGSALVSVRAALAETEIVPYLQRNRVGHDDASVFDIGFEF